MKQRCGKATYPTKADAMKKITEIQAEPPKADGKVNRKGKPIKPRRAYFCAKCDGWHLTSMTLAKKQAIQRHHILSVAQAWVRKKGWDK